MYINSSVKAKKVQSCAVTCALTLGVPGPADAGHICASASCQATFLAGAVGLPEHAQALSSGCQQWKVFNAAPMFSSCSFLGLTWPNMSIGVCTCAELAARWSINILTYTMPKAKHTTLSANCPSHGQQQMHGCMMKPSGAGHSTVAPDRAETNTAVSAVWYLAAAFGWMVP